jgi:hypothetical protein
MRDEFPASRGAIPQADAAPRCEFVTGPRGAGKTRWVQRRIRELVDERPGAQCAVLLAEEGRTRMERFCAETPGVSARRLLLPCMCCPGLADLPGIMRELMTAIRPGWIFVEAPALAATGLMAEFDRAVGWPRKLDICLDAGWTLALRDGSLAPFQLALLGLADLVVPSSSRVDSRRSASGAASPTSLYDPA